MKKGQTSITPGGDRLRAGRFPSGHSYTVRKAGKGSQKMGAPAVKTTLRGPAGDYTYTRQRKGGPTEETYKPTRIRIAGGLVSSKVKKNNTFKQKPVDGHWPTYKKNQWNVIPKNTR